MSHMPVRRAGLRLAVWAALPSLLFACGAAALAAGPTPPSPTRARAEEDLPPGEPPFTKEQLKALPEGVTVRPDGTLLKDGQPTGGILLKDTPSMRKTRKVHRFASTWRPYYLYLSESCLFAPLALDQIVSTNSPRQRITALASTPAGDTVLYAITGPEKSTLFSRRVDRGPDRAVARATEIAPEAWFRNPASLSPDKRWLLIIVSENREQAMLSWGETSDGTRPGFLPAAGDLWLLDLTGQERPRRLLQAVVVDLHAWAPSGQRVVCRVKRSLTQAGPADDVVLCDALTGTIHSLPVPAPASYVKAAWTVDGAEIRFQPQSWQDADIVSYQVEGGVVSHLTGGGLHVSSPDAVWSPDGRRVAMVETQTPHLTITLLGPRGASRKAATPSGVRKVIGWSDESQLLAYLAADGTLALCVGATDESEYERFLSAYPPQYLIRNESRPGPYKSVREEICLDTFASPVKPDLSEPLRFTWTRPADGPCLIYVETTDQGEAIQALRFLKLSLLDLGLDPHGDVRAQLVRQIFEQRMCALDNALSAYVRAHDGNLPSHPEGKGLQEELKPYLADPGELFGDPIWGEAHVHVLPTGLNVKVLLRQLEVERRVKVAELKSDGLECAVYAVPSGGMSLEESLGLIPPLPVNFQAVIEEEAPPTGGGGQD